MFSFSTQEALATIFRYWLLLFIGILLRDLSHCGSPLANVPPCIERLPRRMP
jgi:hypothetical protein